MVTCQLAAGAALKRELARRWPHFRLAYSRPGFLTFKLPEQHGLPADFDLESVFARAYAFCFGRVAGGSVGQLAQNVWDVYGALPVDCVHVWSRDTALPGDHGYEPGPTPEAAEAYRAIVEHCPRAERSALAAMPPGSEARPGQFVLDCTLVEPGQWWLGHHRAKSITSCWPGGAVALQLPADAVSRAWLKMEEALRWSQLPIVPGARCAELGSAPGGASQALLGRGLVVMGVDPAEMHPAVLAHPNFTHIRRCAVQVPRRFFRKIRWLVSDINAAPNYCLDVVESIVTHPQVRVRGMILTLKLLHWEQAEELPCYLARIKSWGYNVVRARQLQFNRQELCVSALAEPFRPKRNPSRRRRRTGPKPPRRTKAPNGSSPSRNHRARF